MTFSFNDGIPATNDNPSSDQPGMLQNNVSTNGIIAVDHITFNLANGGTHTQVHLPGFTTPAVINGTATQGSVLYSQAGVADTAYATLTMKNARALNFPISLIRAYGVFDATGTPIGTQNLNLTTAAPVASVFTMTIATGAINGNTYGVLAIASSTGTAGIPANYVYGAGGTFKLSFGLVGAVTPANGFTCIVFQL